MVTRRTQVTRRLTALAAVGLSLAAGCATAPVPYRAPSCGLRCYAAESDSVMLGYGSVPRRRLTAAVGSVVVRDGDASGLWRLEQLLEGRIAGVDVRRARGDYVVRVRGAGGDPLYVVDGVPFPRGLSSASLLSLLNPADIARIDVLKDAGATAAYGLRGMNGVVLVTTRRAQR